MKEKDPKKAAAKQKRDLIITSVLLIIFAVSFTKNVIFYKKKQPAAPAPAALAESTESMGDQLVYVTNLRLTDKMRDDQRAVWEKEWGRDPFEQLATITTVVKAVNLTLQGVLWDVKTPKAIVNDRTLTKGDALYGYTVIDIHPRSVVLKTGEKVIELSVFRPVTGPEQSPVTS